MAVAIVPLTAEHLTALLSLHAQSSPDYSSYFTPFPFDANTFESILETKQHDQYFVIMLDGQIAGFYMLRGFDQGYATPAYGAWIAQEYSGRGLALATLRHAVSVCKTLGCSDIMLKVHPDNRRAKAIYERFGFQPAGFDPKNGNLVYRLSLAGASGQP